MEQIVEALPRLDTGALPVLDQRHGDAAVPLRHVDAQNGAAAGHALVQRRQEEGVPGLRRGAGAAHLHAVGVREQLHTVIILVVGDEVMHPGVGETPQPLLLAPPALPNQQPDLIVVNGEGHLPVRVLHNGAADQGEEDTDDPDGQQNPKKQILFQLLHVCLLKLRTLRRTAPR